MHKVKIKRVKRVEEGYWGEGEEESSDISYSYSYLQQFSRKYLSFEAIAVF